MKEASKNQSRNKWNTVEKLKKLGVVCFFENIYKPDNH